MAPQRSVAFARLARNRFESSEKKHPAGRFTLTGPLLCDRGDKMLIDFDGNEFVRDEDGHVRLVFDTDIGEQIFARVSVVRAAGQLATDNVNDDDAQPPRFARARMAGHPFDRRYDLEDDLEDEDVDDLEDDDDDDEEELDDPDGLESVRYEDLFAQTYLPESSIDGISELRPTEVIVEQPPSIAARMLKWIRTLVSGKAPQRD